MRSSTPDGISQRHIAPSPLGHHASVLSLIVLTAVIAVALSGVLGGGHVAARSVDNADVAFTVRMPAVVRSGEMLETVVQLVAHKPLAQLVIGVEPSLWREMTTNSRLPEAEGETHADGLLRLDYRALQAGETFDLQVAQQINPRLFGRNRGRIVVFDGDRRLAELALSITVLP